MSVELLPGITIESGNYKRRFEALRKLFDYYRMERKRRPDDPEIQFAQRLIEMHTKACETGNETTKRQHNSFVCRYIGNMSLGNIADKTHVTKRSVSRDIDGTLKRMMVLAFGVDGVEWL